MSTERITALAELGEWPAWLTGDDPDCVPVSGERWRWCLWNRQIRPLPEGAAVRSSDLLLTLQAEFGHGLPSTKLAWLEPQVRPVVVAMLDAMQRVSLVSKIWQKRYGKRGFRFERGVVRQPMTPAQRAEALALATVAEREAALRHRSRMSAGGRPMIDYRPGTLRSVAPKRTVPPAPKRGETVCPRCGYPVGSLLVQQGLQTHLACT